MTGVIGTVLTLGAVVLVVNLLAAGKVMNGSDVEKYRNSVFAGYTKRFIQSGFDVRDKAPFMEQQADGKWIGGSRPV